MRPTPSQAQTRDAAIDVFTQDMAKEFALDHEKDIKAHMHAPWRDKIGEDQYAGSCGCVFNHKGERTKWCGDHY